MELIAADITALISVILIDLALAGDNAVAVGLAASRLPRGQQRRVIFWGIVIALVLRIVFATLTIQLLSVPGLMLLGGLLLFWVAWRMWRDLQAHRVVAVGEPEAAAQLGATAAKKVVAPATFGAALLTVIIADVSMSLDNVLAVAAVSCHNPVIMWFGLILSVVLMGVAATIIARVIERYRWIAVIGIIIIIFAGVRMVWQDAHLLLEAYVPPMPAWLGGEHAVCR